MEVSDWLSKAELAHYTQRSDAKAAWVLLFNWGFIAAIFLVVAQWTNPLTLLVGAMLLGGRHLGLAILMHEAGHKTFFKTQALNRWAGQWLCAYPILADMNAYAASHREHHTHAGTANDPDLPNYQSYPVSKASFRRKLFRDLSGQTGFSSLVGQFSGKASNVMMRADEGASGLARGLFVNGGLLLVLALSGVPELYLMWLAGYLIFYPTVARIRQVAEHGNVIDPLDPDPRRNTRTTQGRWFERLLLCPNHVNYHAEHHFLASVPGYHLKALHRHLVAVGFYAEHSAAIAHGYWHVLKQVVPEINRTVRAAA